jgi:zinc protease
MRKLRGMTVATGLLLGAASPMIAARPALAGLELPPYEEQVLPNGLRVFVMETHEVPLVTVNLLVPVGSAVDGSGNEGIANLTGRLLTRGAGEMTAEQIAESIEEVGGDLYVNTGTDFTTVTANFMAGDLTRALDLVAAIVLQPTFPEDELASEKDIVIAEIAGVKDEPLTFASREFRRALLGEHPYAHPVDGSEQSIAGMTREQVLAFYRESYVPAGSILAIVGDVNTKTAVGLAEARFGAWKGAAPVRDVPELAVTDFPGRRVIVVDKPDATQSQIRIGNLAVPYNTPEFFPLLVANSILGGGFTSRLMAEIRVNRGLSYGARSSLAQMKRGGFFAVYTYTKNASLRETIDVALEQLARMRTERLTDAELTGGKRYITGLFPFELETNDQLAAWITTLTFYGRPLTFLEEYGTKVALVTAEDCLAAARKHFWRDNNLLLVMTNYAETKDQLKGLGKVEVVEFQGME